MDKMHEIWNIRTVIKSLSALLLGVLLLSSLDGCASKELVKTDLKSFLENPEAYEDKWVIITTEIRTLTENPTPYISRTISLTGFVEYGPKESGLHFFMEDEEGRSILCYEREYKYRPWVTPHMVVKLAESRNENLTVVGRLEKILKIELD